MTRRGGPRTQVNPAELVDFLDGYSIHITGGHPRRTRHYINNVLVNDTDARMIRRWRAGKVKGVTAKSANALLERHNLQPIQLND